MLIAGWMAAAYQQALGALLAPLAGRLYWLVGSLSRGRVEPAGWDLLPPLPGVSLCEKVKLPPPKGSSAPFNRSFQKLLHPLGTCFSVAIHFFMFSSHSLGWNAHFIKVTKGLPPLLSWMLKVGRHISEEFVRDSNAKLHSSCWSRALADN